MPNLAYYASAISDRISRTPEGYLLCIDVPICRTGVQDYLFSEIGASPADGDKDGLVHVNRPDNEVFAPETLASFEGKPVTFNHPEVGRVDANNYSKYQKGHMQNIRKGVLDNGMGVILADLVINDPALSRMIEDGTIREVSCGYDCEFVEDEMGWHQQEIRGNHVAVVKKGRAGDNIRIQDSFPEQSEEELINLSNQILNEINNSVEGDDMGIEPNEAKPEIIQSGEAPASESAPVAEQPGQDAPPAAPEAPNAPAPAADPLAVLMQKIDKIVAMLESIAAPKSDAAPEESAPAPAPSEPAIPPKAPEAPVKQDEAPEEVAEKSEAESIIESMDACGGEKKSPVKDAAPVISRDSVLAEVMKAIAPAVSAVQNVQERSAITDALRACVKGNAGTSVADSAAIIGAVTEQAQNKQKIETSDEQRCQQAQAAYRSRNPHHKENK